MGHRLEKLGCQDRRWIWVGLGFLQPVDRLGEFAETVFGDAATCSTTPRTGSLARARFGRVADTRFFLLGLIICHQLLYGVEYDRKFAVMLRHSFFQFLQLLGQLCVGRQQLTQTNKHSNNLNVDGNRAITI